MFPFIDTHHHRPGQQTDAGILPWEAKRNLRRGQPQTLHFDTSPPRGAIHWPQVPPPEPIRGAGGHTGWLTRLFRWPVRAAAH